MIFVDVNKMEFYEKSIVNFVVSGVWGVGSEGNDSGKILASRIASELEKDLECFFILDFRKLNYEWGDSILYFYNENFIKREKYRYAVISSIENKDSFLILNSMSCERIRLMGIFDNLDDTLSSFGIA